MLLLLFVCFKFFIIFGCFYDAEIEINKYTQPPKSMSVGHAWESSWESFMDGASMKDSCFSLVYNIEDTLAQLDNTQRLSSMIDEIPDVYKFKLKHEPT